MSRSSDLDNRVNTYKQYSHSENPTLKGYVKRLDKAIAEAESYAGNNRYLLFNIGLLNKMIDSDMEHKGRFLLSQHIYHNMLDFVLEKTIYLVKDPAVDEQTFAQAYLSGINTKGDFISPLADHLYGMHFHDSKMQSRLLLKTFYMVGDQINDKIAQLYSLNKKNPTNDLMREYIGRITGVEHNISSTQMRRFWDGKVCLDEIISTLKIKEQPLKGDARKKRLDEIGTFLGRISEDEDRDSSSKKYRKLKRFLER